VEKQLTKLIHNVMANLKYKNYILKPEGTTFNLYEVRVPQKTKKTKKDFIEVLIGYNYSFEGVVKKMILLEIVKDEKITTLQDYLREFKRLNRELKEIINL